MLSVSQDHLASSYRITYVLNWKKYGTKHPWPHLGFCPGMCLERVDETNYLCVLVCIRTRHLPITSPLALLINNRKR